MTQWATWVTCYQLLVDWLFFSFSDRSFLPMVGELFFLFCWAFIVRSLFFGLSYPCVGFSSPSRDFSHLFGGCVECFDVMAVSFSSAGKSVVHGVA